MRAGFLRRLDRLFLFSDMLRDSGLFDWLERQETASFQQENSEEQSRFSPYAHASFALEPGES